MKTVGHPIRYPLTPSRLRCLLGAIIIVLLCQLPLSADPPRLKRADAFLGVHFDFHAGKDCSRVGERTTRQTVDLVIDKVQPDYIQIDCKGHPGYSSYPTKIDIRLAQAPTTITQQPENRRLAVTWSEGRASVTLPHLDLYSILVVE